MVPATYNYTEVPETIAKCGSVGVTLILSQLRAFVPAPNILPQASSNLQIIITFFADITLPGFHPVGRTGGSSP